MPRPKHAGTRSPAAQHELDCVAFDEDSSHRAICAGGDIGRRGEPRTAAASRPPQQAFSSSRVLTYTAGDGVRVVGSRGCASAPSCALPGSNTVCTPVSCTMLDSTPIDVHDATTCATAPSTHRGVSSQTSTRHADIVLARHRLAHRPLQTTTTRPKHAGTRSPAAQHELDCVAFDEDSSHRAICAGGDIGRRGEPRAAAASRSPQQAFSSSRVLTYTAGDGVRVVGSRGCASAPSCALPGSNPVCTSTAVFYPSLMR